MATILGLALCLHGCASPFWQAKVPLLTGLGGLTPGSCYTFGVTGRLVGDPEYGTAIKVEVPRGYETDAPVPVMWRPGFSGRSVGSEVEILDPSGNIVATTGEQYALDGGFWSEVMAPTPSNPWALAGVRTFVACGAVTPP